MKTTNDNRMIIAPRDNVAVMLDGERLGHKKALCDIEQGEYVYKYGYPIGKATQPIHRGEWVHTHNLCSALHAPRDGELLRTLQKVWTPPAEVHRKSDQCFSGFLRPDGRAGIRNEVWIIPTVGCVNGVAQQIAKAASERCPAGCDDVVAFSHPYGCSQLGDDHENTRRILADLIRHPNAGGVLVLGLGCENNRIEALRPVLGKTAEKRVRFLECQGVEDEVEEGLRLMKELMALVAQDRRVPVPLSKLVVGLKCGGSDGLSGITANPLVGAVADRLEAAGASVLLTEVPEMFGAEEALLLRCASPEILEKAVAMIENFKAYYVRQGLPVYENPSPGNRDGGITTLEEKALGCVAKGGHAVIRDVLGYGETVRRSGLSLLDGPGNDLVSTTNLAAAGAQLILFTTGRGTPFGSPVPTLKIASNTDVFTRKGRWMDFDAGSLVRDGDMKALTDALYAQTLATAAGARTCNEKNGCRDMAVFKTGVTL